MSKGETIIEPPPLEKIREKALKSFNSLPEKFKSIDEIVTLKPAVSPALSNLTKRLKERLTHSTANIG